MEENKVYKNDVEYYEMIINEVKVLFDGKWEEIVIRICKDEFHSSVGVYCKINNVFKSLMEYVDMGKFSKAQLVKLVWALGDIAEEMQEELIQQKKDVWKCLVFSLTKDDKYDVEYSYDEFDEDVPKQEAIWRYNRLGIIPDETIVGNI